jgi:hypothetical protein
MEGRDAPWQLSFHVLSSARFSLSSVRRLIFPEAITSRPDNNEADWSEMASADQTEARNDIFRCFGRSDRRTQRYWPCESLPRKDCVERGRGDLADKEGVAGSALIYSAGFGMRENVLMQQVEMPRRGPARSRSRAHLCPFFP